MPTEPIPEGAVAVPLPGGAVALIDADDADQALRYAWHLHSSGYAVRARRADDGPGPGTIFMHRSLLDAPAGMLVRRRLGSSRLDNRRANLRLIPRSQNWSGLALRRDNRSGFRGVTRTKRGRWQAQIQVAGKRHFLGYFDAKEDAARAYDAAARDAFGEFAQLNVPPEPAP